MKRLENLMGIVFGLGFAATAIVALIALGTLIFKGPARHPVAAVAEAATADTSSAAAPATGAAAPAADTAAASAAAATPAAAPAAASSAASPAAPAAAAPAAGGVDVAAGEAVFKQCKTCHVIAKGAKHTTGPNLWGVVGRDIATQADFTYSEAMKGHAGAKWDAATLETFLTKPADFAKGTKMTFGGLKKPEDRANVVAWLASQSDTPQTPDQLGLAAAAPAAAAAAAPAATDAAAPAATDTAAAAPAAPDAAAAAPAATDAAAAAPDAGPYADLADDADVTFDLPPYPADVTYVNPPAPSADEIAQIGEKLKALEAIIPTLDYQRARYYPIHFQPAIATASNEECLACHQEILKAKPRETSPAGVVAQDSKAWYQTLDTYAQDQADFHWRHLEGDFAKKVMNLKCNFCHKGNDPREEAPDMMPRDGGIPATAPTEFTLRKMVNPSETCLLCHGAYPATNMGLEGHWYDLRKDMENVDTPNGCLTCHAEQFRTVRHNVSYLNAATIEDLARKGTSDTCYGCHGGRQWYRISYPYPRQPWPGMDTSTVPDWAKDRPSAPPADLQYPPAGEAPAAAPADATQTDTGAAPAATAPAQTATTP